MLSDKVIKKWGNPPGYAPCLRRRKAEENTEMIKYLIFPGQSGFRAA